MQIERVVLRKVSLPLAKPYKVSFKTYETFEPIVMEVFGREGEHGWGEAHIPTGSSFETQDSGWAFCEAHIPNLIGLTADDALNYLKERFSEAPNAVSGLSATIEVASGHPAIRIAEPFEVPLLIALSAKTQRDIDEEIEKHLSDGYKTIKIKVGWDVEDDLARVEMARKAIKGRADISLDANRGFTQEQACSFASRLNEEVKYFEQPCPADAWDANAAVAAVSTVPVMLDEAITNLAAIDRAATIKNVGAIKMKMKRIGGIGALHTAIEKARGLGLGVSIGDGVGTEISCWAEACLTRFGVTGAGEMNGFSKAPTRLFSTPLVVKGGSIVMTPDTKQEVDMDALEAHTHETASFDTQSLHPDSAVAE